MDLVDTHCHLTFEQYAGRIEQVLRSSRDANVNRWITVGTNPEDSQKAVDLAQTFDNLFAAVAVHPHDAKTVTCKTIARLKELARTKKVVAIGETGLDFHYNLSEKPAQQSAFAQHLELAAELNLPIIIHCRDAFYETLDIINRYRPQLSGVVFHCFSGSADQAEIILDLGCYVSFTGLVTFKNAEKTRDAAKIIPLDRLMLETDCPYMSPEPMRKQKVNEPALLIHTAHFLAELKGIGLDDFTRAVTATSRKFFNLPPI